MDKPASARRARLPRDMPGFRVGAKNFSPGITPREGGKMDKKRGKNSGFAERVEKRHVISWKCLFVRLHLQSILLDNETIYNDIQPHGFSPPRASHGEAGNHAK
jgi:hypothetical protein